LNPPAGQVVDYLRLSVTDRCNYRCVYCMPPEGVPFKSHEEILSYEDMVFFVQAAVELGISKVRITGGEPLVRKGLTDLVGLIHAIPGIRDISLTTNGVLLPRFAEALKAEGLNRVNISVDSLEPERYRALTRGGSLAAALDGVEAALRVRLDPVKINVVMMPEVLAELPACVNITRDRPLHVRFIEWMPVGGCGPRSAGEALTKDRMMAALQKMGSDGAGPLQAVPSPGGWGPARYYRFHRFHVGPLLRGMQPAASHCRWQTQELPVLQPRDRRETGDAVPRPGGRACRGRRIARLQDIRQEPVARPHLPGHVAGGRMTWTNPG
jgi:cyclic pyranopterin phosphate synthase